MSGGDGHTEAVPALSVAHVEDFGLPAQTPLPTVRIVPYDPEKTRENYRGVIAMILISLMAAVIAATFALFWIHPDRSKDLEQFFGLVFGPVVALVGAATGYYFGSQSETKI